MNKDARRWVGAAALLGIWATASLAQTAVITSVQGNGQVTWTNVVNTNAIYRLEWASAATGPWHRFTDQPLNTVDALTNRSFSVAVPVFYRVVMATNPPPRGMVWIDGGDVELLEGFPSTNYVSGFWMDEMEVTWGKYLEVWNWAVTNNYVFAGDAAGKATNHPVQKMNWYECIKWCNARSQKEGLSPCYYENPIPPGGTPSGVYRGNMNLDIYNNYVDWGANGYRLPTEAEWVKAARGGRQRKAFPWGGDTIQHAWANYYSTNSLAYDTSPTRGHHPNYAAGGMPYTSPVGSFPANGYGLHDMSGNVAEWCWDWYASYSGNYAIDPRGPDSGVARVQRGGCFRYRASSAGCNNRDSALMNLVDDFYGFRCVRGP
jgi:formylglycine-generating enzyme required for sulfatase activity